MATKGWVTSSILAVSLFFSSVRAGEIMNGHMISVLYNTLAVVKGASSAYTVTKYARDWTNSNHIYLLLVM